MRILYFILALSLLAICVSDSFSASQQSMIIGRWKDSEGSKLEFLKDGTLIINDQGARYRIIDKERIEFDLGLTALHLKGSLSDLGPRPVLRLTVSDIMLTLTPLAKPDQTKTFRRLKMDPSGIAAEKYIQSGKSKLNAHKHHEAIKDFDKAIELDPPNALAYWHRGGAYNGQGDSRQAIKDFNRAIEIEPNNQDFFDSRGQAYASLGDYARAIKDFDKLIELNPEKQFYYSFRGDWHNRLGNYQQAIRDFDRVLELNPEAAHVYSSRGYAYAYLGNYQRAITDVEKAIHSTPSSRPFSYYDMACVYALQNNSTLACQWFRKGFDNNPANFSKDRWQQYLLRRAKIEKAFDNVRKAPCFQEFLKLVP